MSGSGDIEPAKRVLVVEDDLEICRLVERSLRRRGWIVDVAHDAAEALAMAQKTDVQYDAALVDYLLGPGPTGLEVLKMMIALQPGCRNVLMSGLADIDTAEEAMKVGIVRILNKPWDALSDLYEAVDSAAKESHRDRLLNIAERDQGALSILFTEALSNGFLSLALQPIVYASDTHRVFAFEALLRSTHPVLSTPGNGPGPILQAGAKLGRMTALGRAVNRCAAEVLARLPEHVALFVNVDAAQLREEAHLAFGDLLPHAKRVVLEITEHAPLQEVDDWKGAIAELKRRCFRIAFDDLGNRDGTSMLDLLEQHWDVVKIDMGMVRGIDSDPVKRRWVRWLVSHCQEQSSRLIAEGVETAEEVATLIDLGVPLLQGYYFGRPDDPKAWISKL